MTNNANANANANRNQTKNPDENPDENRDQTAANQLRHPYGCPIEGHDNYGCACTPPRHRR